MSTYSAKGDQWTIENPDRKKLSCKGPLNGNGNLEDVGPVTSTFTELTKDLIVMEPNDSSENESLDLRAIHQSLDDDLDFDLGEMNTSDINSDKDDGSSDQNDIENENDLVEEEQKGRKHRGRRKKTKEDRNCASALSPQPSKDTDDSTAKDHESLVDFEDGDKDDDESGDESVDMKGELTPYATKVLDDNGSDIKNRDGEDDEDERTVALSVDGRECDGVDKTLAFSDDEIESDEDDRTIAMSIANTNNADDNYKSTGESWEGHGEQNIIQNKTILVPASTTENDTKMNDSDENLSDGSDFDASDNEKDIDDDNTEVAVKNQLAEAKDAPKSCKGASVQSDDDENEMEFYPPPANEDSDCDTAKATDNNSQSGTNIENVVTVAPKETKDDLGSQSSPSDVKSYRRSSRARKPRVLHSVGHQESVLASVKKTRKDTKEKAPAEKHAVPQDREWVYAADVLFCDTEDKSAVTVKQIFQALEEKFSCKITKRLKTIVRDRLKALIMGTVKPSCTSDKQGRSDCDDDHDDQSSKSQSDSDGSEDNADDEASVYTDDEGQSEQRPNKKKNSLSKKKKASTDGGNRRAPRTSRPKRRKAAARAAAKVVEAHRLRQKKRAEELKVRNEEMQLDQSKEDEERQQAIAAKFETNTEELRLKRLEDRLDLLKALDETRISVVADTPLKKSNESSDDVNTSAEKIENGALVKSSSDTMKREEVPSEDGSCESDDDSSDEEDLVIVGKKKPFKPLKPLHNNLPSRGLQLLEEIRSPRKNKKTWRRNPAVMERMNASTNDSTETKNLAGSIILSPNRSMGARFALRNALKQKQRKQGNRWLARELGYKTEEDHLKDCQTVADQKRGLVVKLEQERLKANERKQLRERIILQEQQEFVKNTHEDDSEEEAYVPEENDRGDGSDEEDEEMKLAKEIEQETRGNDNTKIEGNVDKSGDAEKDSDASIACKEMETMVMDSSELNDCDKTRNYVVGSAPSSVDNEDKSQPVVESKSTEPESSAADSNSGKDVGVIASDDLTTVDPKAVVNESVVTPEKKDADSDDYGELEFSAGDSTNEDISKDATGDSTNEDISKDPTRPRNAGWQAMLKREEEKLKKRKKRKGGLVEEEAEEEEEEEIAGLEDFGFSISKKKKNDDDEDEVSDQLDEDDLKHVVDDVSDGEGDEDAGRAARKQLEQREEKNRHKEILRRMREGYDGRRGGIAGGGTGARGMHRFDQLVAADNREDAKRLGLLNDDELDSEDEKEGEKANGDVDDEEDETALLDKMLKDRFLHRSNVELEENFSEDEEEVEEQTAKGDGDQMNDEEVRTQERLAKRFAKRARMQRLEEMYADSQEFSQQRLIDEDTSMRDELSKMRCGLLRRTSSLSRSSSLSRYSSQSNNANSNLGPLSRNRQRSDESSRSSKTGSGSMFQKTSGSLSLALRASKKRKHRTSFLGGSKAVDSKETAGEYKVLSLSSVLFNSKSASGFASKSTGSNSRNADTKTVNGKYGPSNSSLFSKISGVRN